MKLTVTTPLAIVVDADDVAHLRAEDETGAFGILPGHADFLTALAVSVVTWRDADRRRAPRRACAAACSRCATAMTIAIATREAVPGDDLHRLEAEVLARFRRQLTEEQAARADAQRLYLAAIRQIYRSLSPADARCGSRMSALPACGCAAMIAEAEEPDADPEAGSGSASTRRCGRGAPAASCGSAKANARSARTWR